MIQKLTLATCLTLAASTTVHAEFAVELGGPATGYAALSNFKNSSSQNGIEGLDANGDFNPNHNGLPDYPNYQMANGNFTAIIASPLDAGSDYSDFANFGSGFTGPTFTVNNQTVSQANFSRLSAGRISFDNSLYSTVGNVNIPVADLSFDFNTFEWDGVVDAEPRSNFQLPNAPIDVSPFSPVFTKFNDGSGAGNAQVYYLISIDNVTGDGLTFVDGELTDIDFAGDITVDAFVAPFAAFGSFEYTGTLTADGLGYEFNVSGTDTLAFFSNTNFLMNRSGTAVLVPEPAALALLGLGGLITLARRRRRGEDFDEQG
ncbi:MAG: PEP-CTERM sorting domain-containing protein [Planctomycetota bacterium]